MSSRKPLNARPKSARLFTFKGVRPCCLANSAYVFINSSLAGSLTSLRKLNICSLPTLSSLSKMSLASTSEGVRYVTGAAGTVAGVGATACCSRSLIRCRIVLILASNSATCVRSSSFIGLRLAMRIRSACSCNASSIAAFNSTNSALAGDALERSAALTAARTSDKVTNLGKLSKSYFSNCCLPMLRLLRITEGKSPSSLSYTPALLCML